MAKKPKKSWQEKLADNKGFPRVLPIDPTKSKRWGSGTFVIPAPAEVDALMKRVGPGELTTIDEIRKVLAQKHHATIACPLTTGIFAWIAANAAAEAQARGDRKPTPFWRTLKSGGTLNPKYPGGVASLKEQLEAEGHRVIQKGAQYRVEGYERHLAKLK